MTYYLNVGKRNQGELKMKSNTLNEKYEEAKTNYIHATEELINKRGTEEESFWVKEVKRTMTQFLKLDTRLHNAK
jgi:hypothetical protein